MGVGVLAPLDQRDACQDWMRFQSRGSGFRPSALSTAASCSIVALLCHGDRHVRHLRAKMKNRHPRVRLRIASSTGYDHDSAVHDMVRSGGKFGEHDWAMTSPTAERRTPARRCAMTSHSTVPHTSSAGAELRAQFQREAVALREPLFRHAKRMTRNQIDAEDLLHDTIIKAFANFHSFQRGTNLNAWLHCFMTNTHISSYRTAQRQPAQCSIEQVGHARLAASTRHRSIRHSAEDQVLEGCPDNRIRDAVTAVPEKFRIVVYYADIEDLRYKEIAEILNTPQGTIKSRLHHGRQRLRTLPAHSDRFATTTMANPAFEYSAAEVDHLRSRARHPATRPAEPPAGRTDTYLQPIRTIR